MLSLHICCISVLNSFCREKSVIVIKTIVVIVDFFFEIYEWIRMKVELDIFNLNSIEMEHGFVGDLHV